MNLRDVTKLMSAQIEKIEKELERKLTEKDKKLSDMKKKLDFHQT